MRVGIIADDLTGAADSAAPFADRGMRCATAIGFRLATDDLLAAYDVLAISTETRDCTCSKTVAVAVTKAVRELNTIAQPQILCKKIDSTLRGNLTTELSAVADMSPGRIPMICPSFPAHGRIVLDGRLVVFGEKRQRVLEAFDCELDQNSFEVNLVDIRRGTEWIEAKLRDLAESGARAVFFDAESNSDLTIVSKAVLQTPDAWLPVGSAGFIGAIAAAMAPHKVQIAQRFQVEKRLTGASVLFVCGSKSSVSRNQVAALERAAQISRRSNIGQAVHIIDEGYRIAIAASPDEEQDQDVVLENLLAGIDRLDQSAAETALIVTGGATASAFLRKLAGSSHLEILGELEPGVVITKVICRSPGNLSGGNVSLVLKAGGFGDEETMVRIAGV